MIQQYPKRVQARKHAWMSPFILELTANQSARLAFLEGSPAVVSLRSMLYWIQDMYKIILLMNERNPLWSTHVKIRRKQ